LIERCYRRWLGTPWRALTAARHIGELWLVALYVTIVVIKAMHDNDEDF
jgi:hypothetical protein